MRARLRDLTGQCRTTEPHYFVSGGQADIWKGEWMNDKGTVKVIMKVVRGGWTEPKNLERLKQKLLREGSVWSSLQHPHITPFLGISFDFYQPNNPCLVCPYYINGDIGTYLQNYPRADKLRLISQAAAGLVYLHNFQPHPVVHGDIKGGNILINERHEATLTDFGLSRILETSGFTTKSVGGTCRWMARELVLPGEDDDLEEESTTRLTTATDVWAFAMTILEILTGRLPFPEAKYDSTVILGLIRGQLPERKSCPEVNDKIWDLLQRCWSMEPGDRPSMRSIALALNIMLLSPSPTLDVGRLLTAGLRKSTLHHDTLLPLGISRDDSSESFVTALSSFDLSPPTPSRDSTCLPQHQFADLCECNWPGCPQSFVSLRDCQAHEVNDHEVDWKNYCLLQMTGPVEPSNKRLLHFRRFNGRTPHHVDV